MASFFMKRLRVLVIGLFLLLFTNCKDNCNSVSPGEELSFGIFSETASEHLEFDVNSFIGTFDGPASYFEEFEVDSVEKQEGSISLRATISVDDSLGGYAGWFIGLGNATQISDDAVTKNMSDYECGRLRFLVKSPINLEVGIRSGNVEAGGETSKVLLSEFRSFKADNSWREVCIPLSKFKGSAPKADMKKIKIFFVVASNTPSGGTGGVVRTFWIDNVRWENTPCP